MDFFSIQNIHLFLFVIYSGSVYLDILAGSYALFGNFIQIFSFMVKEEYGSSFLIHYNHFIICKQELVYVTYQILICGFQGDILYVTYEC